MKKFKANLLKLASIVYDDNIKNMPKNTILIGQRIESKESINLANEEIEHEVQMFLEKVVDENELDLNIGSDSIYKDIDFKLLNVETLKYVQQFYIYDVENDGEDNCRLILSMVVYQDGKDIIVELLDIEGFI